MKEYYYVIINSDGDTRIECYDKETLLKGLAEKWWGSRAPMSDIFNKDTNYWGEEFLIIKGSIVKPIAEEVITKYSIH